MSSLISNAHNLPILKNEAKKHANVKVIFSKKNSPCPGNDVTAHFNFVEFPQIQL